MIGNPESHSDFMLLIHQINGNMAFRRSNRNRIPMIGCRLFLVEGFSALLQNIIKLCPEFQPVSFRLTLFMILRNTLYRFYEIIGLLDDLELRGRL